MFWKFATSNLLRRRYWCLNKWLRDRSIGTENLRYTRLRKQINILQGETVNDKTAIRVHWSFWVIGSLALVWNVMGVINFFVQMNPEMLSSYRESERAIIAGRPAWATAGFALAVFGGSLGCLLLLLRRSAANVLFIVSLFGVLITTAHTLGIGIDFAPGEMLGIVLMPAVVAVFLVWYSKQARSRGWIRQR